MELMASLVQFYGDLFKHSLWFFLHMAAEPSWERTRGEWQKAEGAFCYPLCWKIHKIYMYEGRVRSFAILNHIGWVTWEMEMCYLRGLLRIWNQTKWNGMRFHGLLLLSYFSNPPSLKLSGQSSTSSSSSSIKMRAKEVFCCDSSHVQVDTTTTFPLLHNPVYEPALEIMIILKGRKMGSEALVSIVVCLGAVFFGVLGICHERGFLLHRILLGRDFVPVVTSSDCQWSLKRKWWGKSFGFGNGNGTVAISVWDGDPGGGKLLKEEWIYFSEWCIIMLSPDG